MQPLEAVVALHKVVGVVGLLEHLIHDQHAPAVVYEVLCEIDEATSLKVEIVHAYVEALLQLRVKVGTRILKQEGRLTHTARAADAYHPVTPVYPLHKRTLHGSIEMTQHVSV